MVLEATYLAGTGRSDQAISICDALTRSHPGFAPAWGEAGRLHALYDHDYARAAELLTRAVALDSTVADYYDNLSSTQILLGRPQAAAETAERGIALCGETVSLDRNAAEAFRRLGDVGKSAEYVARAQRLGAGGP
jgi:tetratricopeptide (TPR) repeat protein